MKPERAELETSIVDILAYDEWLRRGLMRMLSLRALSISTLYFLACLMFARSLWASLFIWVSIYVILVIPIGRRRVERFGLLFFGLAAAWWIDIVPFKKYAMLLDAGLEHLLQALSKQC